MYVRSRVQKFPASVRVISPSHRPLPANTQHSQQTNIHAPGGIRTHNPSKREAADPRLRPRGQLGPATTQFNLQKQARVFVAFLAKKEKSASFVILMQETPLKKHSRGR